MKRGGNLTEKKSEIIDSIVRDGVFRPELLNRFDGVILFHPIEAKHLRDIAKLMLGRLGKRLSARGYELIVNDELLDFLVKFGSDPKFGARPMNRAIQDKIEQRIADKIIKNELVSGQKIEFSMKDLDSFY
jgi:ATP-dependent Clp protease ATP-binding subunit ClpA